MGSDRSFYLEVLDGIRHFQKRNRAVGLLGEIKISLLESHLLTEVGSFQQISGSDLAKILNVPKQEISRLGLNLGRQGLVSLKCSSSGDGRTKYFSLTTRGREFVSAVDKAANPNLLSLLACLQKSEVVFLRNCLSKISDAASIVYTPPRTGEPHIRPEVRRITRALTLMRRKVFGSSLNPTEWHVLSELSDMADGRSVSDITFELKLSLATVSASLNKLHRRRMVRCFTAEEDGRSKKYIISTLGITALKSANLRGAELIKAGLRSYSSKDRDKLIRIFNKIASY